MFLDVTCDTVQKKSADVFFSFFPSGKNPHSALTRGQGLSFGGSGGGSGVQKYNWDIVPFLPHLASPFRNVVN